MGYLGEWKLKYAKDLAAALNNKKVLDNLRDGMPYPYRERDAHEFIRNMIIANKNMVYGYAIMYEGKCIGSIAVFRQINVHCKTGELGYFINEEYWGKGITTAAVKEMCDYIFENTDIVRIFVEPFATNVASIRVLEKNGFQYEGTMRKNAYKNGEHLDMALYSKIK